MAETVTYQLKSRTDSVVIPKEYAEKAEALVKLAMGDPSGLPNLISEFPCLGNPGILSRTAELINTSQEDPHSFQLQDIVYLRVCINLNESGLRDIEKNKAFELDETLVPLVKRLEQHRGMGIENRVGRNY